MSAKLRGGVIDGAMLWVETKEGDEDLVQDPTLEELGIELEGYDGDTEVQFRIKQSEYNKGANVNLTHCLLKQDGGEWEVKNLGKPLYTTSIGEGEDEIKLVVRGHMVDLNYLARLRKNADRGRHGRAHRKHGGRRRDPRLAPGRCVGFFDRNGVYA